MLITRTLWPKVVELVLSTAVGWYDTLAIVRVVHEPLAFFANDLLGASYWFSSFVIGLWAASARSCAKPNGAPIDP